MLLTEITGWPLAGLYVASAILLGAYLMLWKYGRVLQNRAIDWVERRYSVSVVYTPREIKVKGNVDLLTRVGLGLLIFFIHFAAMFLPLLLVGGLVVWIENA